MISNIYSTRLSGILEYRNSGKRQKLVLYKKIKTLRNILINTLFNLKVQNKIKVTYQPVGIYPVKPAYYYLVVKVDLNLGKEWSEWYAFAFNRRTTNGAKNN
jgi:hypothetical protein